jgi:hypothetical protein
MPGAFAQVKAGQFVRPIWHPLGRLVTRLAR